MAEIVKKKNPSASAPEIERSSRVIESEVFDASRKAREMTEQAHVDAESILENARQEAEALKSNAHAEGFEEGKAEALAMFQQSILQMNEQYEGFVQNAEDELLGLSIGVAQKVLQQELKQNPEVIVQIVKETIRPMNRKSTLTMRVHPEDQVILEQQKHEIMETLRSSTHFSIVADPSIQRGGCYLETEHGSVDARLDVQFGIITELLTGAKHDLQMEEPVDETPEPIQEPEVEPTPEPIYTSAEEEAVVEEIEEPSVFISKNIENHQEGSPVSYESDAMSNPASPDVTSQEFSEAFAEAFQESPDVQAEVSSEVPEQPEESEVQEEVINELESMAQSMGDGVDIEAILQQLEEGLDESQE